MVYLKRFLLFVLALILIVEEWLWGILTALGNILTRLLHLQKIELWLSQCPPKLALSAFIVPFLLVAPINLLGLGLMVHGLVLRGVALEIIAKLLGTLLVARVFKLTKKQLLTFRWFHFIYNRILQWLAWAHATTPYRLAKALKTSLIQRLRR